VEALNVEREVSRPMTPSPRPTSESDAGSVMGGVAVNSADAVADARCLLRGLHGDPPIYDSLREHTLRRERLSRHASTASSRE
jgi:hypothetical protein